MNFDLRLGGSERGYSWYLKVLRCPRSVWLAEHAPKRADIGPGKADTGRLNAALVGTLFHAYLECLYRGDSRDWAMPMGFLVGGETLAGYASEEAEAFRMFHAYRGAYRDASEFPDALTEGELRDESGALGVPLLTGRVDLSINWPGGALAGSDLFLRPGRYIVDHKTAGSASSSLAADHEAQMWVYQWLWNRTHPNDPCLGAIINEAVKTREPKFRRVFVPPPTDKQIDGIRETLTFAWGTYLSMPQLRIVSNDSCITNYGACAFRQECLG